MRYLVLPVVIYIITFFFVLAMKGWNRPMWHIAGETFMWATLAFAATSLFFAFLVAFF